jgi:hypothetical protein
MLSWWLAVLSLYRWRCHLVTPHLHERAPINSQELPLLAALAFAAVIKQTYKRR